MSGGRLLIGALSTALLAGIAAPALGQGRPGRLPDDATTIVGNGRRSDTAETEYWRYPPGPGPIDKTPIPSPLNGEYMRPFLKPLEPTKTGPTTIDDLRIEPAPGGGLEGERPGHRFDVAPDGTLTFRDRRGLDLTDYVIRMQGGDPYAHDKSMVREMTEPARRQMNDEERLRLIDQALLELPDLLTAMWNVPATAQQRRALIFELWDELLEGGPTPEGEAATRARATIEGFVREHLPEGHEDAYPVAELERLNARRTSREAFAPYAQPAR